MQQLNTQQTNGNNLTSVPPLYLRLKGAIGERIISGEWKPGHPVPNEADFAKEFGVSSGTMRKALDALEAEGYLTRKQGRGTFVNDKQADDDKRKRACVRKSLLLIREATNEAGVTMSTRLQPVLQTYIAESLFKAGYSGDAP